MASRHSHRWSARRRSSAAWSGSIRSSCPARSSSTTPRCSTGDDATARVWRRWPRRRSIGMSEGSLLLNAAVYLLAAVVFVPTAVRFGLGSVIGYLIAGCVIGPFVLGLVRDVHAIFHFAEFGVVLMLFVIGLELDLDRLWELRRSVFVGGAVQMVGCGAVLAGAGWLVGLPPAAALVAGLSLALSSTAVAAQTMSERGMLASPTGRAAFGVLLFQDLAAIPLIAVVPLLAA